VKNIYQKHIRFSLVFYVLGAWKVAEASWGLSLRVLASWGHLETMLRHVGAKMAIKSAKMSQRSKV